MLMFYFRSVSENQRALALGAQFLFLRILGSIPGPVIVGSLIDNLFLERKNLVTFECFGSSVHRETEPGNIPQCKGRRR